MDEISIFSNRLQSIESLVLGQDYVNSTKYPDINVIDKIDEIIKQMNNIDTQLPVLQKCRDIASKLRPYILQGKINLAQIGEKVNELVVLKTELQINLKSINSIDKLKSVIDNDYEWDYESMGEKLNRIQTLLDPLIIETNRQTKELDSFLDNYEHCMKLASDICVNWKKK